MDKIKYALIGFGGIAENRLAKEGFACDRERFAPLADAELIGATDINPQRREAAEALGLKWYDSIDAILNDSAIDAVFVATNNMSHAEIAKNALEAGKHVIVEKPIATIEADAVMLVELAGEKGLSLTVDHMMTANAWNEKAKECVESGSLGQVNDACFHMEFCYGATPEEAATWRCSKPEEFGGPIGDVASHCFYMAEFIFNSEIVELACVYYPKMMDIAVEDGAYIKYKMSNGLIGSVRVAFSEPRGGLVGTLSNLGYELFGSDAVLRSFGPMFQLSGHPGEPVAMRLEIDRGDKQEIVTVDKIDNIYQRVIASHARSVIDNKPMSGYDALHNIKLVMAAHESARSGGKIVEIK